MDFQNRRAIVTGGNSGIGRATAMLLARSGALVGFCGTNDEAGHATVRAIEAEGGRAMYVFANVGDEAQVADLSRSSHLPSRGLTSSSITPGRGEPGHGFLSFLCRSGDGFWTSTSMASFIAASTFSRT
jgi:hypothetical protein